MAEPTIQLGGGNWAGKSDNLLGYYKEGDRFYKQDFTFSRSTTGTYTDSDGYIQEMPYNKLLQSNDFDTTWGNYNSTETYDSNLNAWLIEKTGIYGFIRQFISLSGEQTLSVYAKASTLNWLHMKGSNNSAYFDLENGVLGSYNTTSASIESVGNGFYRCSITYSGDITDVRIYPADGNNDVSGTSGSIYIQNAQLVKGTSAKTYFPTTTRLNIPRVDYLNNSNGSLILEPQRTNLLPYSDFSSGFTTTNVTLSNNQGTSPDGTSNATKALMASGTGSHRVYDAISSSLNDDNVISVFIKEQNDISHIGLAADTMSNPVWFSGSDGSIINANGLAAKTESFGNGWHRISVYYVADSNDAGDNQFIYFSNRENTSPNVAFDGTEEILLYGIQAEKGKYLTTLINTSGSSVTRNADACSITNVADRIGQTEGTLYVEFKSLTILGNQMIIDVSDNSSSDRVGFQIASTVINAFRVSPSDTTSLISSSTISENTLYKCAFAYENGRHAFYLNGSKIGEDTNLITSMSLNKIDVGQRFNGTEKFSGSIIDSKLYNTALTDAELITLTT